MKNLVIQGENIGGLNYLLSHGFKETIDLIYVDPPFATGSDFLVSEGRASTVSNSKSGRVAYTDKVTGNTFINDIRKRMILAKELLSPRGSIYLHTDYKIGHCLKVMMDEVFGSDHFRSDSTRIKCNPKNFNRSG